MNADPERNRHRDGRAWTLRTVAVILGNPRYTGRQVWYRQGAERGAGRAARRSSPGEWAVSATRAHPSLIGEAEFVAAQQIRAARPTRDGLAHRYLLAGLVRCAVCGRRMDAHWVHGRAGYRCRHSYSSSRPRPPDARKNVYVREDVLLRELAARLQFDPTVPNTARRASRNIGAVIFELRTAGLVICHDGSSWDLTTA